MNIRSSIRDQGSLLSRHSLAAALHPESHKHHLCRWFVIALCFASSCAHAQRSLTLAWDRNTETNIAGYKLYYGTVSRVYTNVVNVGNATTASVTDLVAGLTYRFAVTAFNTAGAESDFSTEIAHTVTNVVTPNIAPTLTSIPNRTIAEDAVTPAISFTIADVDTPLVNLTLSGTSSDLELVPNANIVFGGSGANRTVRVTPAPNQFGTTSIRVSVSDGTLSASRTFQLTVTSSNDPPTMAPLAAATVVPGTLTLLQPVLLADIDTAASGLIVTASSSDTEVLPHANILLATTGLSRSLSVLPLKTGVATVTLRVSDGIAQVAQSFSLTVTNSTGQFALRPTFNVSNGGFTISWASQVGYMYRILTKTSLTQANWTLASTLTATDSTTSWTDLTAGRQAMGMYMIEMAAPVRLED